MQVKIIPWSVRDDGHLTLRLFSPTIRLSCHPDGPHPSQWFLDCRCLGHSFGMDQMLTNWPIELACDMDDEKEADAIKSAVLYCRVLADFFGIRAATMLDPG
jgi:hypothetical protein